MSLRYYLWIGLMAASASFFGSSLAFNHYWQSAVGGVGIVVSSFFLNDAVMRMVKPPVRRL